MDTPAREIRSKAQALLLSLGDDEVNVESKNVDEESDWSDDSTCNDEGVPSSISPAKDSGTDQRITNAEEQPFPQLKKKSPRKSQHKENNSVLPPVTPTFREWRGSPNKKPSTPKSKGISPKTFHRGSSSSSTKRRSRPGMDKVRELHSTVQDNVVKQQLKELSTKQKLKRSAFKQITSLRTWPLQDLAMQDYRRLLQAHLHENTPSSSQSDTDDKPEHQYGDTSSSASCSTLNAKRIHRDHDLSPAKMTIKNEYLKEFQAELGTSANNVATIEYDPQQKFDSGLWSLEPRIFSVEKAHGKRKYLVGHLGRILDFCWRKTDRSSRHFYELIQAKTPCRLYFDLEYSIPDNPDITCPETLLDEFFEELRAELITVFPDECQSFDRTCVVDLDSSTPQKFSRHWIVHLPHHYLFRDNAQVGKFVKRLIQRLADQVATGQLKYQSPLLLDHLFVYPNDYLNKKKVSKKKPALEKTCFVDMGVYTRNRLFRVLGSSKFGKSAACALRIAPSNQFPFPQGFGNHSFYVPAMEADTKGNKKTHDEPGKENHGNQTDDDDDDDGVGKRLQKYEAMTDWTTHAAALATTLVVPINGTKIDYPLLPEIQDFNDAEKLDQYLTSSTKTRPTVTGGTPFGGVSHGQSPFPCIDEFVSNVLATRHEIYGSIRAWSLNYTPSDFKNVFPLSITYQINRNRWCECIGREHKSNNIMWTVDLLTHKCFQTCWDPECRALGFRGTQVDLPPNVIESVEDALFEHHLSQMDDKELFEGCQQQRCIAGGMTPKEEADFEKALVAINLGDDCAKDKNERHACPQIVGSMTREEEDEFERALLALDLDDIIDKTIGDTTR